MIAARVPKPLKIIAGIYLVYLALMTLVAMPLLNVLAPKIYRAQTGRVLQLDKIILLNPFTLALTVRNASSANPDGSRFWAFDRLRADLSLATLWRLHPVLDAIELDGLYLQVEQTAADRYNFSDILDFRATRATPATQQPQPADGKPLQIDIARIAIGAAHLGLRAPHFSEPLNAAIENLQFTLDRFTTATAKNAEAGSVRSGPIALALQQVNVDVLREPEAHALHLRDLQLKLEQFSGTGTQPYQFSLRDHDKGELHLTGKFALDGKQSDGELRASNVDLVPALRYIADKIPLQFKAQRALLDGEVHYSVGWGEPLRYRIDNSRVALREVQLQSRTDADTNAAFGALELNDIQVDSAQPRVEIKSVALKQPVLRGWNRDTKVSLLDMIHFPGSDEQSDAPPWQVLVDAIDVDNGELHWRASQLDNLQLTLAPLMMRVTNLHWPDPAPLKLAVKTAINGNTKLAVDGELVPGDLTGTFSSDIERLPLTWGNRLLGQQLHATLASGLLSGHAQLALDKGQPTLLRSDGSIEQFELQHAPDKRKLLAWKQLQWRQLAVDLRKQSADLQKIIIAEPWVQFRINADGTNNFQQLVIAQPGPATQPTAQAKAAPTAKPAEKSERAWQFAIDNIHADNATLDFRDGSLSRSFHTTIRELTGDIDGLTNRNDTAATIAFKGSIDGYAPVALTGKANPFAAARALNVTLDMTNLDLATLTPYSGTYAGYAIDGGRLTVQLNYTLENDRIRGSNHIVVNQLQLGQQVRGPKVMDLPLRFAIYLLTDSEGVMDLGVDVTGSVDDPDFSVGSIIWKAFRNLIVKTATSPFRALGKLVGGGDSDDLDRVAFAAGSDRVEAQDSGNLQKLAQALQKKSALKLGLTGHVSPWQDIEALRDSTLSEQLIAQGGISHTDIQQQTKNWQREVVKLFKQRFPGEDNSKLVVMQMNDAMRDNIELKAGALQELASRRAIAVKEKLVAEHGLAAERAFIKPVDLGIDKNPGLQVTMDVE